MFQYTVLEYKQLVKRYSFVKPPWAGRCAERREVDKLLVGFLFLLLLSPLQTPPRRLDVSS